MSLLNLDKSLGCLRSAKGNQLIQYEPFEFSNRVLGVVSASDLKVGSQLIMENNRSNQILLSIIAKFQQGSMFRYRLASVSPTDYLGQIIQINPRTGLAKSNRQTSHLQSARFTVSPKMFVQSRTFGSADSYILEAVDISRSGLLLCAPKPWGQIPFIEQTLLEIKLDMGQSWSDKPIEPLAKVVRLFADGLAEMKSRYYGVKFVEFTNDDNEAWHRVIVDIEKTNLKPSSPQKAA